MKEIQDTKLLVSLPHNTDKSANMAVFDISQQGKVNEIYSLGEVKGSILNFFLSIIIFSSLGTGCGDVTYNPRRGILGAIPVSEKIAYHLFNVDVNASKTEDVIKLYRKSNWHSQYSNTTACN